MKNNQLRAFAALTRSALLVLALFVCQAPFAVQAAESQTFYVNRTDDPNPDGCNVNGCSLREAVIAANANPGMDTILLPAGTITLSIPNSSPTTYEINAARGDLDITDDVAISCARTVVTAPASGFRDRIFHVVSPSPATRQINVIFNTMTIRNGSSEEALGGSGILIEQANVSVYGVNFTGNKANSGEGGGITNHAGYNNGRSTLIVRDSTFDSNTSLFGGGIYNVGTLFVDNSLFFNNKGSESGGGIDNNRGTADIVNSTFTRNISDGGAAISNSATVRKIKNATIVDNEGVGLFMNTNSYTYISNSILSQKTDPYANYANCAMADDRFTQSSQGYNLLFGSQAVPAGRYDCIWIESDIKGQDPNLGTTLDYFYNVGETPPLTETFNFKNGTSPAIDAIPVDQPLGFSVCPGIDQRSRTRWVDGDGNPATPVGCDIGAFEEGGQMLTPLFLPLVRR